MNYQTCFPASSCLEEDDFVALRDEATQCAIDQLPGHNVLGWLLMALRDDQSGQGAKHLITLYQANRNIPIYKGIAFLYGREPVNRD